MTSELGAEMTNRLVDELWNDCNVRCTLQRGYEKSYILTHIYLNVCGEELKLLLAYSGSRLVYHDLSRSEETRKRACETLSSRVLHFSIIHSLILFIILFNLGFPPAFKLLFFHFLSIYSTHYHLNPGEDIFFYY